MDIQRHPQTSGITTGNPVRLSVLVTGLLLLTVLPAQGQTFGNEPVDFITAGSNIVLNGTQVKSNVMTGQNITGTSCGVAGDIIGKNIRLNACNPIGSVVGQAVEAQKSHIERNLVAGNGLKLVDTTVDGNVTAAGPVELHNSVVGGKLTVTGEQLVLKNTKVGTLVIQKTSGQTAQHQVLLLQGGSIRQAVSSHAEVHLGPHAQAQMNGYHIESLAPAQTRVTTPDGIVYLNGGRESSTGPGTYAGYQAQHPEAPDIQGPGWTAKPGSAPPDSISARTSPPPQETITLGDRTIILGDVIFDGAPGFLSLSKGAELHGHVVNGSLKN